MERELTYQLPFERLARLSHAASRKAYPAVWWLTWLLVVLTLAAVLGIALYTDTLETQLDSVGIPFGPILLFLATAVIFLAGSYGLRRMRIAQVKERAAFNETIRLTQEEGGLRFATEEVEHYLKWRGISQLLLDHDGVIVSHGNLFFLIPDRAFASTEDRIAFIRVHERLGERARSISEKNVSAFLKLEAPSGSLQNR